MKVKLYKKLKRKYKLNCIDDHFYIKYKNEYLYYTSISQLFYFLYSKKIINYTLLSNWDDKKCRILNKKFYNKLKERQLELNKLLIKK